MTDSPEMKEFREFIKYHTPVFKRVGSNTCWSYCYGLYCNNCEIEDICKEKGLSPAEMEEFKLENPEYFV